MFTTPCYGQCFFLGLRIPPFHGCQAFAGIRHNLGDTVVRVFFVSTAPSPTELASTISSVNLLGSKYDKAS